MPRKRDKTLGRKIKKTFNHRLLLKDYYHAANIVDNILYILKYDNTINKERQIKQKHMALDTKHI